MKYLFFIFALAGLIGGAYKLVDSRGYERAEQKYQLVIVQKDLELAEFFQKDALATLEIERLTFQTEMNEATIAAQKSRKKEIEFIEVEREVISYVESPDAGKCAVPDKFVRLHTAAIKGSLPQAASSPLRTDDGTRRFTDIDVLTVDTANYKLCNKWRDQLIQWQAREKRIMKSELL